MGVGSDPKPAAVADAGSGHAEEKGARETVGGRVVGEPPRGNRVAATSARPVVGE